MKKEKKYEHQRNFIEILKEQHFHVVSVLLFLDEGEEYFSFGDISFFSSSTNFPALPNLSMEVLVSRAAFDAFLEEELQFWRGKPAAVFGSIQAKIPLLPTAISHPYMV